MRYDLICSIQRRKDPIIVGNKGESPDSPQQLMPDSDNLTLF